MNDARFSIPQLARSAGQPARWTPDDAVPWIPGGPGKSAKPLRFLSGDRGFIELMRLEPGTEIPPHRHTGEVHAYNLEGSRKLSSGEIVGPGDYVFEPAGNVDSWTAVGDEPLTVLVIVMGSVEYLGRGGVVTQRITATSQREAYLRYCSEQAIEPVDLVD